MFIWAFFIIAPNWNNLYVLPWVIKQTQAFTGDPVYWPTLWWYSPADSSSTGRNQTIPSYTCNSSVIQIFTFRNYYLLLVDRLIDKSSKRIRIHFLFFSLSLFLKFIFILTNCHCCRSLLLTVLCLHVQTLETAGSFSERCFTSTLPLITRQ